MTYRLLGQMTDSMESHDAARAASVPPLEPLNSDALLYDQNGFALAKTL
jgi:hypothetical protein